MLHFSVANLIITIINLVVLYLLMKKFLFGPVNGIMEKRKAFIEEQMERAKTNETQSLQLKEQYEEKVAEIKTQSHQMIDEAKSKAGAEREQILKAANLEAQNILNNARESAREEREKAMEGARTEIAGLAVLAARKMLSQGSDEKGNQLLYEQFLAKAGDGYDADGR